MTPLQLQRLLSTGTCDPGDRLGARLVAARRNLLASQGAHWADLVVLVRQALERWASTEGASHWADAVVRVPESTPWPTAERWRRAGITADAIPGGRLRLACAAWSPDWLADTDRGVVEAAAAAGRRRPNLLVPNDPLVVRHTGHSHATSTGQRDAIRGVFLSPPRANVLVLLPTGAGKSTVFQFAALHGAATGAGMVVVVIPTTALARDQEDRFREVASQVGREVPEGVPLAFHEGLSPDERKALGRALREGTIPIAFLSPEAMLGSLQRPLLDAATRGLLSTFAIDEAHMVAQWGEFRPQFQAVAGMRDALRDACPQDHPFRTVLLTATLTGEGFDVLSSVFGDLRVIAEVALRTEPSYLLSMCADGAEKQRRIDEALYHLPRPLILYTTRRKDTEAWYARMGNELGFKRVRRVLGGDMSTEKGAQVLREWKAGDIDVVVATSAFGLGVDQSDVRSVVHACVPESIDRWYQEVGRGGRDGHASVALLVADSEDEETARSMARERLLEGRTAWGRWTAMRTAPRATEFEADPAQPAVLTVPLDLPAAGNSVATENDVLWSLRTITMMAQAGMLRFAHALAKADAQPVDGVVDESARLAEQVQPGQRPLAHVVLLDDDHLAQDAFIRRVEAARARRIGGNEEDIARLRQLVAGEKRIHDLLAETYRIPVAGIEVPATAGDCPTSRRERRANHDRGFARVVRPRNLVADVSEPLRKMFGERAPDDHGPLIIAHEGEGGWTFEEDMGRLALRLAALGIVEFGWPASGCGRLEWSRLAELSPARYVYAAASDEDPMLDPWWVPRVTLLFAPDATALRSALGLPRPRHVLLVPAGLRDPFRPDRSFDQTRVHCRLSVFLERLRAQ